MGHIVEDAAQEFRLTGPQGVDGVVDLRAGTVSCRTTSTDASDRSDRSSLSEKKPRGGESMMT